MSRAIVIFGATSAIAQAICRIYATQAASFVLVARDATKLQAVQSDLQTRGAKSVQCIVADLNDTARHPALVTEVHSKLGRIDLALIAHGVLNNQQECEQSFQATLQALQSNCLSAISLLTDLANTLERQGGQSTIAVISSVAGDRGRQSNYVYGTAKGAINTFMQGLRNRLAPKGIAVITIKPGFVDTPMTANIKKGPLFASAETVARAIVSALERGKDEAYVPWFWWGIMLVIRSIPERIFKRLKL